MMPLHGFRILIAIADFFRYACSYHRRCRIYRLSSGGSHLERGDDVYIIDDLSTGSMDNIRFLQEDPRYKNKIFVHINTILNHDMMLELTGICDVVYHLAAAVGVKTILDKPLESIVTNIQGTEKVLEMCNKFKKRVLIASTSEVYGKHLHAPLVETDNIIYGPSSKFRWSYAASKLMDEFTALAHYRTNGLEVVITRLFNTVGPKQTGAYGMVIPRFVAQALKNEPITVFGDGTQTRTFTYVKDVVSCVDEIDGIRSSHWRSDQCRGRRRDFHPGPGPQNHRHDRIVVHDPAGSLCRGLWKRFRGYAAPRAEHGETGA
jgi:dTDP-D-glucose 4,6-dehydratase